MKKEDLLKFLRQEQKLLNVNFYINDFEFADRLLNFINSSDCKDKTPKVITNEKAKEVCCSTCRHARGYSCTNSQTCKGDYEFWEQ